MQTQAPDTQPSPLQTLKNQIGHNQQVLEALIDGLRYATPDKVGEYESAIADYQHRIKQLASVLTAIQE